MISKKCDWCKKEIESKGDYPWSEWCLFHHRKRRDFCSGDCLNNFIDNYFKKDKIKFTFEQFETRCKEIAKEITKNKNIHDIFAVGRGGMIPAVRISHLTGLPLTGEPNPEVTAIIDDCIDTGDMLNEFTGYGHYFVLVDKQLDGITEWVEFFWEEKE